MPYDPFIRGSSSADLLAITLEGGKYFIEDTIALTKKGRAPISREIGKGGTEKAIIEEPGLAWSHLLATGNYSLDKVIKSYACQSLDIYTSTLSQEYIGQFSSITYFMHHIFDIMIYCSRSKQFGYNILSKDQLLELDRYFDAVLEMLSL